MNRSYHCILETNKDHIMSSRTIWKFFPND